MYIVWHQRLGYMPLATIRMIIDSCQGLDDLLGVPLQCKYVSANVSMGKATSTDQPKPNMQLADQPLQVVNFDIFGACKQTSFAGHNYCVVLMDYCTRYSWVYTIKRKS